MASAFLGAMVAAGRMVASQAAATVGQASDAGSGEQRGAEGSALFGCEEFDGVAVDVGLDLAPERAARAAAAEADALRRGCRARGRA